MFCYGYELTHCLAHTFNKYLLDEGITFSMSSQYVKLVCKIKVLHHTGAGCCNLLVFSLLHVYTSFKYYENAFAYVNFLPFHDYLQRQTINYQDLFYMVFIINSQTTSLQWNISAM